MEMSLSLDNETRYTHILGQVKKNYANSLGGDAAGGVNQSNEVTHRLIID
jgi:hypothetical protein